MGDFNKPYRYRFFYGGRGGAKSWTIARMLIIKMLQERCRVLCAREYQTSIKDSVKFLIEEQIRKIKLEREFKILDKTIECKKTKSEMLFMGVKTDPIKIKGKEAIKYCWVEEAENISRDSIEILSPTIRMPNSEIWFSFNPKKEQDYIYRFMHEQKNLPDVLVRKVNWRDNPWFHMTEMVREREAMLKLDIGRYNHVWEGEPLKITEAAVFKRIEVVDKITPPHNVRYFHGADWGFSSDACTIVRCYIFDNCLYIDAEAYAIGVELDHLRTFFEKVPTTSQWPIKADCARPETISFMQRKGYNISGAKKWKGSIEDGVSYLQSFQKIIIDKSCENCIREFTNYSYKVDKNGDVLPVIDQRDDHTVDAVRYALDGYITNNDNTDLYENMKFVWG